MWCVCVCDVPWYNSVTFRSQFSASTLLRQSLSHFCCCAVNSRLRVTVLSPPFISQKEVDHRRGRVLDVLRELSGQTSSLPSEKEIKQSFLPIPHWMDPMSCDESLAGASGKPPSETLFIFPGVFLLLYLLTSTCSFFILCHVVAELGDLVYSFVFLNQYAVFCSK